MNNEKALNWLYNNHPDFSWDMVDFTLEDKTGVYCIYDTAMGLAYFGKSANVRRRVNLHKSAFLRGAHYNPYMQASYSSGSDFKYFYVRYTEHLNTSEFLEAHWASVFGCDKVFNVSGISGSGDYTMESTEIASSLGYKPVFPNHGAVFSIFTRCKNHPAVISNAPAIESARKLIL